MAPDTVHVFVSTGRFGSFNELQAFVEETYTEDGDRVPSAFTREVGLSRYESACIECVHRRVPSALSELLSDVSYSEEWLAGLPTNRVADAAICVFAPNEVERPYGGSLEYVGRFAYRAVPEMPSEL